MPSPLAVAAELARQTARSATYWGINELASRFARRIEPTAPRYVPQRPVPTQRQLFGEIWKLLQADAALVADGICPPFVVEEGTPLSWLARIRAMVADMPEAQRRRREEGRQEVRADVGPSDLPDYYTQNFHYQTGGYLTEGSARIYDVQVETLFMGTASLMRRQAMRPIAEHLRGRDQRDAHLADIACGTGRFLGQLAGAYPRLNLTGIDLSDEYLAEARRHIGPGRQVTLTVANAEAIPLADASQDVVSCIFMFHELPHAVRRRVTSEMARVLKPGGLLVLVDSLQWGDRPGWDGLLEAFPHRFHEPYYRNYLDDDLGKLVEGAGLALTCEAQAFMAKIVTARRPLA
jgi:ubiquinone/menaquinone biosynthesis C-methylase UbiE